MEAHFRKCGSEAGETREEEYLVGVEAELGGHFLHSAWHAVDQQRFKVSYVVGDRSWGQINQRR